MFLAIKSQGKETEAKRNGSRYELSLLQMSYS